VIKLDRVTKVYPDGTEAVKEVSFEVSRGEVCVLLGPSGCGKTTTMKMINRLLPITSGKIYIDGVDNTQMDVNELRRNMGYAIQQIGLFPNMTVGQNIETVPELKGWPKAERRQRAEKLLELVGLDSSEFIDKYPNELSGGQAQRVGVARALGADPPILLMDEPFGAIDPITRVRLQDEFLKIQQEIKKTVIFVTHDIYEAIKMADRVALMKEGQLVQYDTPANLLYRPKNEFVEDFVGTDRALKGLQLIRVKEVMNSSPVRVKSDEKVETAGELMKREGIGRLVVVDDDGGFLGWVERADLGKGDKVKEVMSPSAVTAKVNTVLNEVLSLMLSQGLENLAIVSEDNRLQGVINFDTIRQALAEVTQKEKTG
jgi:osmoprotectant transport system ATP-binding protein